MTTGKVMLVTGASGGIGSAIALLAAQRGCRVGLHYHTNKEKVENLLDKMPGKGHFTLSANLNHAKETENLVRQCQERAGKIDILVNNAGIYQPVPFDSATTYKYLTNFKKTLYINLFAPALLCFETARLMESKGGCRIVNISSRGAFRGEPDAWAYGSAKAGLNALGQSMAKALGGKNIFVFTVAPGFVETEMSKPYMKGEQKESILGQSPLHRVASPEEVAGTAIYCALDAPDFMTGSIIDINGASYLRS